MPGYKRDLKGSPRSRQEQAARAERIQNLFANVLLNDPHSDPKKLKQAIQWSERHIQYCRVKRKAFPFSDPLQVAEYMVSKGAKGDAVTAAFLFPSITPTEDQDYDRIGVTNIHKTFGSKVGNYVQWAVQFDSLKLLPLIHNPRDSDEDKKKKNEEHLRNYLRAGLEVAVHRDVILLLDSYRLVGLMDIYRQTKDIVGPPRSRQQVATELDAVRDIVAPIAYRAGLSELRSDLLDWHFRVEKPALYESIKAHTSERITQADLDEAKEILSAYLSEKQNIDSEMFRIDARIKSVDSIDSKTWRKKQTPDQLGDVGGLCLVFDEKLFGLTKPSSAFTLNDFAALDQKRQGDYLAKSGTFILRVMHGIKETFGRNSSDPAIIDRFRNLAAIDPHPDIAGLDGREDDYITNPKKVAKVDGAKLHLGYSSAQDSIFIRVSSGRYVEIELQAMDAIRFLNNKEHPTAGHDAYKSKIEGDRYFQEWRANNDNIDKGLPSVPSRVWVYDENHWLHALPAGSTVGKFAQKIYGDQPVPAHLDAWVDNDDPTLKTHGARTAFGMGLVLNNADRVVLRAPSMT